jgi:hypothetical protein
MDSAEDDVFAACVRSLLGKFVRIAPKIGIADDFITLIMVPKNHNFLAEFSARRSNAVVHGVIGKN